MNRKSFSKTCIGLYAVVAIVGIAGIVGLVLLGLKGKDTSTDSSDESSEIVYKTHNSNEYTEYGVLLEGFSCDSDGVIYISQTNDEAMQKTIAEAVDGYKGVNTMSGEWLTNSDISVVADSGLAQFDDSTSRGIYDVCTDGYVVSEDEYAKCILNNLIINENTTLYTQDIEGVPYTTDVNRLVLKFIIKEKNVKISTSNPCGIVISSFEINNEKIKCDDIKTAAGNSFTVFIDFELPKSVMDKGLQSIKIKAHLQDKNKTFEYNTKLMDVTHEVWDLFRLYPL